ncbi:MAG: DinB family protein [Rhodothermales bacterium]
MTKETVLSYLTGEHTHVHPQSVLQGCSWEIAGQRLGQSPHSIYRILNHIIFWQDLYLARMNGQDSRSPDKPSTGWPGAIKPESADDWSKTVALFSKGLEVSVSIAESRALEEKIPTFRNASLGECLVFLALHNGHHLGQIITMRQALGEWGERKDVWTV